MAHGVVQARADGPDGDVQHVGDFFVRQFLFETQFQACRVIRRGDCGWLHAWWRGASSVRRAIRTRVRDGGWIALSAVVSREHVTGDAEEPGAGHGDGRQLIRLADDLQEGFLQEIAGGRGIGTASGEVAIKLARML